MHDAALDVTRLLVEIGLWSGRENLTDQGLRGLASLPNQAEATVALRAKRRAQKSPAEAVSFITSSEVDLTQPRSLEVVTVLVDNLAKLGRHPAAIRRTAATAASRLC